MLQSEQALLSPPEVLWERLPFIARFPAVVWSQWVTYHLMTTEMRAGRRRKAERKRLFQKLYSHQQVFSALWNVSYHLGFLKQLELSTQPVRDDSLGLFPCSFTCLWHDLESCHSASCWVSGNGLGWSITPARHFSCSVPKPPSACVLRG